MDFKESKIIPELQIQNYIVALNQKFVTLCDDAGLNLADLTRLSGLPRSTLEDLLKGT